MPRRSRLATTLATILVLAAGAACVDEPRRRPPVSPGDPPDAGMTNPADSGQITTPDGGSTSDPDATAPGEDAETFPDADQPRRGIPVLGSETHDIAEVTLIEIGSGGLRTPRDLAFNPVMPDELWVVNRADDSTITYIDLNSTSRRAEKRIDPYALHFMEEVSSIAFGKPGHFATCQESRNTYDGQAQPDDFMGPSLWPSDLEIYAMSNPAAIEHNGGFDLGSHLDMLHESPLCMGIAWERDNIYWTFDGLSSSISRYDFQMDHGPGYDDHSDGIIQRFVAGEVRRVANVPSHLVYDHDTGLLYIADTGNSRIAVLDTTGATQGRSLQVTEPGTVMHQMDGVSTTTLIDGPGGELMQPSGLALDGDYLYVADYATSRITAFSKTGGERIDWLDTGLETGTLMGIELRDGSLYFVDSKENRLMKISPK